MNTGWVKRYPPPNLETYENTAVTITIIYWILFLEIIDIFSIPHLNSTYSWRYKLILYPPWLYHPLKEIQVDTVSSMTVSPHTHGDTSWYCIPHDCITTYLWRYKLILYPPWLYRPTLAFPHITHQYFDALIYHPPCNLIQVSTDPIQVMYNPIWILLTRYR